MLLPVRTPGRHGVLPEENVRVAEVRESVVGHFLSQAHASAFDIEHAAPGTFWPPGAQHPERRSRPQLGPGSAQLIQPSMSEFPNWI